MSAVYDMLADSQEEFERNRTDDECQLLYEAVDRIDEAHEEDATEDILSKLREAVGLAALLRDEPVLLAFQFFLANELIGAQLVDEALAVLQPAALKTREPQYADKPHRIGLNNLLASAYAGQDPIGYAEEIRLVAKLVADSPAKDQEDSILSLGNCYEVELAKENFKIAKLLADEIQDLAEALDDPDYHVRSTVYQVDIAFYLQDWAAIMAAVESKAEYLDEADIDGDSDYWTIYAASMCARARLGERDFEPEEQLTDAPVEDLPMTLGFYMFMCDHFLVLEDYERAEELVANGLASIDGQGQHHNEVEMYALMLRTLRAAGHLDRLQEYFERGCRAAQALKDPERAIERLRRMMNA